MYEFHTHAHNVNFVRIHTWWWISGGVHHGVT